MTLSTYAISYVHVCRLETELAQSKAALKCALKDKVSALQRADELQAQLNTYVTGLRHSHIVTGLGGVGHGSSFRQKRLLRYHVQLSL